MGLGSSLFVPYRKINMAYELDSQNIVYRSLLTKMIVSNFLFLRNHKEVDINFLVIYILSVTILNISKRFSNIL